MNTQTQKVLASAITELSKNKVTPYTTTAEVININDKGIIYVRIPGSENVTPVKTTTVKVKPGDIVNVAVSHTDTHITGNRSDAAITVGEVTQIMNVVSGSIMELDNTLNIHGNDIKMINSDIDIVDSILVAIESDLEVIDSTLFVEDSELGIKKSRIDILNSDISIINSGFKIEGGKLTGISKILTDYIGAGLAEFSRVEADTVNALTGHFGTLLSNIGLIRDFQMHDGHITGYLDAVKINANSIDAGKIYADNIYLKGPKTEDGKTSIYYAINYDPDKEDINFNTIDGNNITEKTITADHIVFETLTGDKAFVNAIFANDITANGTITGVTLKGINAEINKGLIGSWHIDDYDIYWNNSNHYIGIESDILTKNIIPSLPEDMIGFPKGIVYRHYVNQQFDPTQSPKYQNIDIQSYFNGHSWVVVDSYTPTIDIDDYNLIHSLSFTRNGLCIRSQDYYNSNSKYENLTQIVNGKIKCSEYVSSPYIFANCILPRMNISGRRGVYYSDSGGILTIGDEIYKKDTIKMYGRAKLNDLSLLTKYHDASVTISISSDFTFSNTYWNNMSVGYIHHKNDNANDPIFVTNTDNGIISVKKNGYYKLSLQAYISSGFNIGDIIHVGFNVDHKYTQNSEEADYECSFRVSFENPWTTISMPPFIRYLYAGDYIMMLVKNQNSAKGTISASHEKTFMTIEKLS